VEEKMKNHAEHIENIALIARHLAREASMDQVLKLEKWIRQDESNQKLFDEYQKAWDHIDKMKTHELIDIDQEWKKLDNAISESSKPEGKVVSMQGNRPNLGKKLLSIAAGFVFIAMSSVAAYFIVQNLNKEQLVTEIETKDLTLPDGSQITLNANSTIKYPKEFSGETRKVKLEGEAFFSVQSNHKQPFIVDAGNLIVRVTGTSFNISNYETSTKIVVIVEEGEVEVSRKNDKDKVILKKGEKAEYNRSKKSIEKQLNKDINYLSWKTRKLRFRDDKLSAAIHKINKVYHTNIVIESEAVKDCLVTSDFIRGQNLESVLSVLQAILPNIELEKQANKIIIKGESCH